MSSITDPLLTEHLTYRPVALVDDIVNSINTLSFRATEAVEKGLLAAKPSSLGIKPTSKSTSQTQDSTEEELPENIKHEIENGVHQLETLLESKIDKNFDRWEIYVIRNILNIPDELRDWVRLDQYNGLNFSTTAEEGSGHTGATAESVKEQRLKLRELTKLRSLLLEEKRKNEETIASIASLLGRQVNTETKIEPGTEATATSAFGFLEDHGTLKGDKEKPVTTSTSFVVSQLPALRSMLEDLGPRLDALDAANSKGDDGMVGEEEKSFRRERAEFVETRTRRHLENVRGLELGEMGDVRDGDWQGEGSLGKGEVEGLERIVGALGGEKMTAHGRDGDPMDES